MTEQNTVISPPVPRSHQIALPAGDGRQIASHPYAECKRYTAVIPPHCQPVITSGGAGGVAINMEKKEVMGYWSTPAWSKKIHITARPIPNTDRCCEAAEPPGDAEAVIWWSFSEQRGRKRAIFVRQRVQSWFSLRDLSINTVDSVGCQRGCGIIWLKWVNKWIKSSRIISLTGLICERWHEYNDIFFLFFSTFDILLSQLHGKQREAAGTRQGYIKSMIIKSSRELLDFCCALATLWFSGTLGYLMMILDCQTIPSMTFIILQHAAWADPLPSKQRNLLFISGLGLS